MSKTTKTKTEDTSPDCCDKGGKFIWWHIDRLDDDLKKFTGWGMCVDHYKSASILHQVKFCPFCGKELADG